MIPGCGKGRRRPSTGSTQSELTTRPVIQQFTGQVTILNVYATPTTSQAFQPTDNNNETGTRPITTSAAESTT
eukprot:6351376-Amphidinium_carterae.1